jgi:hypothetical protein
MRDRVSEILNDEVLMKAILEVKERELQVLAAREMCEDVNGVAYKALDAIADGYALAIDILYGLEVIE